MSWKGWKYVQEPAEGFSQVRPAEDVALINSGIDQILNTTPGERRMLPEFGSRLRYLIFDPHDEILYSEIGREVIRAIEKWEPRVILEDVQVVADDTNDHAVRIYIAWRLKTNQRVSGRTGIKVSG